jgi:hypothetical protein
MDAEDLKAIVMSRRSALKRTAATAFLISQATLLEQLAWPVVRPAAAATTFPDIQFAMGGFINPAQVLNDGAGNVTAQFPPTYGLLLPAKLTRTPTVTEKHLLGHVLYTIEDNFPASPAGVLIFSVSYGLPYFNRLSRSVVSAHMPHLLSDPSRFVLEEAAPSPTDVVGGLVGGPKALNPGITKDRFNVNVTIENNDMLFHFRSDSIANLTNVSLWLQGSNNLNGAHLSSPNFNGLISYGTPRIQFVQAGLPRKMADQSGFEFAPRMNPNSSMAMGFVDQQVNAAGPPEICTFAGNSSARLSDADAGDYFDNGSIAHFSHNIEDLYQFYNTPGQDSRRPDGEPFTERCQYMFRSNQLGTSNGLPASGHADQYTNGGGPAYVNNVFQGTNAAAAGAQDSAGVFSPGNATINATFQGQPRIGHEAALQQISRAPDGTPMHIRADGPGLDGMDVPAFTPYPGQASLPAGSAQFKLQFLIYVPSADFFARMRAAQAAQTLQQQFLHGADGDNGVERFITATRRQNVLVPPRRNRAFPLIELA